MESRSQRGEQKSQEQHVLFSRTQVDMGEAPERYKSSVSWGTMVLRHPWQERGQTRIRKAGSLTAGGSCRDKRKLFGVWAFPFTSAMTRTGLANPGGLWHLSVPGRALLPRVLPSTLASFLSPDAPARKPVHQCGKLKLRLQPMWEHLSSKAARSGNKIRETRSAGELTWCKNLSYLTGLLVICLLSCTIIFLLLSLAFLSS